MDVTGNYENLGYLHVRELIPPEVARAFLGGVKEDLGPAPIDLRGITRHGLQLRRPAFQIYGHDYRPMSFFLFALTPTISKLTGRDLLPAYDYFRIYREGDICRVHSDRPSCEHSVSLTLDYSDGEVWDLQVARQQTARAQPVTDDFGPDEYSSVGMKVGDAVLYQGVHHRHGRITANPNAWSAHLFLHFVERGGPYEEYAFDKKLSPQPVNFSFV
jgi:hypothetical protein